MKRERQKEVFIKLINKQLEPFGKTYTDVVNEPEWNTHYKTTFEKEKQFAEYAKEVIMTDLGLDGKTAENEVSWFILQWGLVMENPEWRGKELNLFKQKEKLKQ